MVAVCCGCRVHVRVAAMCFSQSVAVFSNVQIDMKINIDSASSDETIRTVFRLLEQIESGTTRDEALREIKTLLASGAEPASSKPNMFDFVRTSLHEYENDTLDLAQLKDEILTTLDEFGMLNKAG